MHLEPIEYPKGLIARIAYWLTRRKFGKVITPLKVAYARVPASFRLAQALNRFQERGLTIPLDLYTLLHAYVSHRNGCAFCLDLVLAHRAHAGLPLDRLNDLDTLPAHAGLPPAERAALAFAQEATQHKHVSDETMAELKTHYCERHIAEIAFVVAIANYYNTLNGALGIGSDGLCPVQHLPKAAA